MSVSSHVDLRARSTGGSLEDAKIASAGSLALAPTLGFAGQTEILLNTVDAGLADVLDRFSQVGAAWSSIRHAQTVARQVDCRPSTALADFSSWSTRHIALAFDEPTRWQQWLAAHSLRRAAQTRPDAFTPDAAVDGATTQILVYQWTTGSGAPTSARWHEGIVDAVETSTGDPGVDVFEDPVTHPGRQQEVAASRRFEFDVLLAHTGHTDVDFSSADRSAIDWGEHDTARYVLPVSDDLGSGDRTSADAVAGSPDSHPSADPVAVAERIAAILGVTQIDVITAARIAERTFYDWKANHRRPRLASMARLWTLDQLTSDLKGLLDDPASWLRVEPARRDLLQTGRFDELAAAALDSAQRASTFRVSEREAALARLRASATAVGPELTLDLPAGRPPRRTPTRRRRPARPPSDGAF